MFNNKNLQTALQNLVNAYRFGGLDAVRNSVEAAELALKGVEGFEIQLTEDEKQELRDDENYQIGVRDGREQTMQEIDQATGGDGEYCYVMNDHASERHCPTPEDMKRRIVARFENLQNPSTTLLLKPQTVIDAFNEIMRPENADKYFSKTPERVMIQVEPDEA